MNEMQNAIVKVFENKDFGNIEIMIGESDDPLFELYSVGAALGYISHAKGKIYPYKERIDKIVKNAEISLVSHGVKQYLTESTLYDFLLESKSKAGRKFRKWVVNEVLPSIRKTGGYVAEGREQEFLNNPDTNIAGAIKELNSLLEFCKNR